jgi:hypothetical protein
MIQIKSIREFNSASLTAKDACRIFSNTKPYLVRVEDSIHFTKDFQGLIARKYPDVSPDLVEVYLLNNL